MQSSQLPHSSRNKQQKYLVVIVYYVSVKYLGKAARQQIHRKGTHGITLQLLLHYFRCKHVEELGPRIQYGSTTVLEKWYENCYMLTIKQLGFWTWGEVKKHKAGGGMHASSQKLGAPS